MDKKKKFNGIIKTIGNIVMVVAIIFIIKGLISYDIDYSVIVRGNNLIVFCLLIIAYTLSVIVTSVPWKNIVYLITGEKIKFVEVATVSTKANVMKYIPGNIFQYIGRNGLAVEKGLKHSDIAISTLIDVAINLGTVFLVTILFSFKIVFDWIKSHVNVSLLVILLLLGIVVFVLIIFFLVKNKEKYIDTINRVFSKKGIATIISNIIIYSILSLYTTVIYIIVLYVISEGSFGIESYYAVAGAVLASWIIGFITPGAPGGMGIRETVLIMIIGSIMTEEAILLGVVVNRVVSIMGDVLALIIMQIVSKVWRRKACE